MENTRVIGLACDHAGYERKEFIKEYLESQKYTVVDYGCNTTQSVDYPEFAHAMAEGIENGKCQIGFAFCGSANGITMTLNKHQGIRAAISWEPEIASLARQHNDANVCSIPARFTTDAQSLEIAIAFLKADFEGGRHQRRVDMIAVSK